MTKEFKITITGKPFGKQRPRFSTFGKFVKVYTPKETEEHEKQIKEIFLEKYKDHELITSAICLEIFAYMPIPKSTAKKYIQDMINNVTKAIVKPDLDNISKLIKDALNGVAYKDDNQVVEMHCYKMYSFEPRVEIIIKEIK